MNSVGKMKEDREGYQWCFIVDFMWKAFFSARAKKVREQAISFPFRHRASYNTSNPYSIFLILQFFPQFPLHQLLPTFPSQAVFKPLAQNPSHPSQISLSLLPVHSLMLLFQSAVIFSIIIDTYKMRGILLVLALACWASAVDYGGISNVNEFSLKPVKKGLTFQATVWPRFGSNWAGRFSCNNCNPFEGDQTCDRQLPLVCITSAKALQRPLYNIAVQFTPFAVLDGGYYDGWTGGVIQVTVPVRGYDLVDYNTGNALCQGYFGSEARWAKFNDGFYMPFMNKRPVSAWGDWDWSKARRGGWNFWGYFNHHYRGRAWVYVDGQPNGNCGR